MPHDPVSPPRRRRARAPAAVALALAAGLLACGAAAQSPAAGAGAGDCASIADDRDRLACYDRAFGAPGAGAPPPVPPVLAVPPVPAAPDAPIGGAPPDPAAGLPVLGAREREVRDALRALPTTLGERWELDPDTKQGRWLLRPYRPVYVLPVQWTDRFNGRPFREGGEPALPELPGRATEAVFQLSFKAKLAETIRGTNVDLWAAYTQVSHWQVWTPDLSRPFRETNYEPEIFAIRGFDAQLPFGWRARFVGLGINHQSNGRGEPLSRSWNRVIAQAGFERGDWTLLLRPWWRLRETDGIDDNPGILDHVGRAEAVLVRRMGANLMSVQFRHSLRGGDASRGSVTLELAVPLSSFLKGHLRVFSGYGETLIDYNHRQTAVGLGISLLEWL